MSRAYLVDTLRDRELLRTLGDEAVLEIASEAAAEIELARDALKAMVGFAKTKVAEGMVDHAPELEAVRTYLRHS